MATHQVAVFRGDDASPEVIDPTLRIVESLNLPIEFIFPLVGEEAIEATGERFPEASKAQIDAASATLFGSTSGNSTQALFYLRWGKQTFANVRPCKYIPGAASPLKHPDEIDFVIIRENLEDLYLGLEGPIEDLAGLNLYAPHPRTPLKDLGPGRYAIKAITEFGAERVIRFAFELARKRNGKKKVTLTSKYNMLAQSDGLFREIGKQIAAEYPDIAFETFIVDDFLCRMITKPEVLDVVVTPNLYGDILSDGSAGLIGGLGLAPSGCYGADYAYFESAHGTAPDIQGQNIINPTATLLSATMMLDYLGFEHEGERLVTAVHQVYKDPKNLTPDQGGKATTTEFCSAVSAALN